MDWKKKIKNKAAEMYRFVSFVSQHFIEDDCSYRASALAFTSLLAVVPLMSVGLAVLSTFPVFHNLSAPLQDFIFENFVPATGKVIQAYLQQFTAQVSKLSLFGLIFLFVTALLVMVTIERAMNKIWRVTSARKGSAAFLLYWSILSLTPILLGFSLAVSSYIISMPYVRDHQGFGLFRLLPFFLSLLAFTFLYVIVPNCKVKIRDGFWGALVAAGLFETAKMGFAFYLRQYNTYELLYGAFATVPLFFVWVYWVWFITLLGAEISFALSVHHLRRFGKPIDGFSHVLLWLNALWQAQQEGRGVSLDDLVNVSNHPFAVDVDEMMRILVSKELVHRDLDGHYWLNRDLSQLRLFDLTEQLPYRLPNARELADNASPLPDKWKKIINENHQQMQVLLGIDLHTLFKD